MRTKLKKVFDAHFTKDSGAAETMMALFGAAITVAEINTGPIDERTKIGVNEMLYSFAVGLPMGNPFWQRASVILFPLQAAAMIDMSVANEYLEEEAKLSPDDPQAAELRRRAAQCMGGYLTMAVVALTADRGLGYAQKNARRFRDEITAVMEG